MRISDLTTDQVRAYFERRGVKFRGESIKQAVHCPFHQDRTPSLSIDLGKAAWKCFVGCGSGGLIAFEQKFSSHSDTKKALKSIFEAVGETWEGSEANEEEPEKIYSYVDERGRMLFQKLRFHGVNSDGSKRFVSRRPLKNGWAYELKDVRRVLYNLPSVITANQVAICEGERDADEFNALELDTLDRSGFSRIRATTNYDGGSNWDANYAKYMAGKDIVILPDFDVTGLRHAEIVANSVQGYAVSV